jgi:hypothetical protein
MFIDRSAQCSNDSVRRSEIQVERDYSRTISLLRTEPKGSCSSIYKHVTPNGVKSVDFAGTSDVEIRSHSETALSVQISLNETKQPTLSNEFIPTAVNGKNETWLLRIWFQLLPEMDDVRINRACVRIVFITPHRV